MSETCEPMLNATYERALVYAAQLHADQCRKRAEADPAVAEDERPKPIPYLAHLLSVSALILEHGGDQEQAIAGLLHDALEDQGDRTSRDEIARLFGVRVADIVFACSDTTVSPKPPWRERKEKYIAHLETASTDVLLVSCADKLHNARAILGDHRELGNALFDRFSTKDPDDHLWYYGGMTAIFSRRLMGPLSDELARVVDQLRDAVAADA